MAYYAAFILFAVYMYYLFAEELSWKSNVGYLATCPIKKKEGLSGKEPLKLLVYPIQVGKDSERKYWI